MKELTLEKEKNIEANEFFADAMISIRETKYDAAAEQFRKAKEIWESIGRTDNAKVAKAARLESLTHMHIKHKCPGFAVITANKTIEVFKINGNSLGVARMENLKKKIEENK